MRAYYWFYFPARWVVIGLAAVCIFVIGYYVAVHCVAGSVTLNRHQGIGVFNVDPNTPPADWSAFWQWAFQTVQSKYPEHNQSKPPNDLCIAYQSFTSYDMARAEDRVRDTRNPDNGIREPVPPTTESPLSQTAQLHIQF